MITPSNPPTVHSSGGGYSHAMLVTGPGRRLVCSGQVGMAPDGSVPATGEAQIAQCLANLGALLAASGMQPRDVVKVTVFLTDAALIGEWRAQRNAMMAGHAAAATLLIVAGLADPRFMVEVEAEAFQAAPT